MAKKEGSPPPLKKRKPNVSKTASKPVSEKARTEGLKPMQSLSMLAPMFHQPPPKPASNCSSSSSSSALPIPQSSSTAGGKNKTMGSASASVGPSRVSNKVPAGGVISIDSDTEEGKPRASRSTRSRAAASTSTTSNQTSKTKVKGKPKATISDDDSNSGPDSSQEDSSNGEAFTSGMMWTDLFSPSTIEELAPSKTRIGPLRSWLHESMHGERYDITASGKSSASNGNKATSDNRYGNNSQAGPSNITQHPSNGPSTSAKHALKKMRRLLVLSGPAGVGKTTSLRVIAKDMGLEVIDWVDESEGFAGWGGGGESSINRFISLLSRSSYNPLELDDDSTSIPRTSSQTPLTLKKPRLILLSSLPTLSTPTQRATFQSALSAFVKSYDPSNEGGGGSCPLVIVIPDEGLSGTAEESWMARGRGGEKGDGWNAKAIVGEALTHPATSWMTFPSIAPTFMTKALKRVLNLATTSPIIADQIRSTPSDEVMRAISQTANGDLRSAINSLQFLCTSGHFPGKAGGPVAGVKKKGKGSRGGKGGTISGEKKMLEMLNAISRREQSLGLFHALGKVLYNKRIGDPSEDKVEEEVQKITSHPMPDHLSHFERRPYENDFDDLLGTVPVDTATFTLWLHQNVPQYCEDIDQNHLALDDICASDIMKTDTDFWATNVQSIAYAFHVSVRGTTMALPSPVPRNNQKLFKPAYFDMLRRSKDCSSSSSTFAASLAPPHAEDYSNQQAVPRTEQNLKVWMTELMPFFRQMKRCDGENPKLIDIDASGLALGDGEESGRNQWLAVLHDGDEADDGDGDAIYEEAIDAASSAGPAILDASQAAASVTVDKPEEVTWLLDDDIED